MMNKLCLISIPKNHVCSVVYLSSRKYSEEVRTLRNPEVTSLRRGTGGRSSFSGNVVTVFGATGFLGTYICNQLGKRGTQLIIPYRGHVDDYPIKKLKLCGDLGQVLFQPFDLRDPISIRKAIKYSNIVINLIGCDFETRNFDYYSVHVKAAKEIAQACREFNVEQLIHFSTLNAPQPVQRYYVKKIQFLPSKLEGEKAVMNEFPQATIFRPAMAYGYLDKFLWPLLTPARSTFFSVPLYAKGKKTIKQPIYAGDIGVGVVNAINNYDTRGKIYQLVGPERFYLHDIVMFCCQLTQRQVVTSRSFIHDIKYDLYLPLKLLYAKYVPGIFWHQTKFNQTFEQIERESETDVVDPCLPTLEDLGVTLTNFEHKVPHLIVRNFLAKRDIKWEYTDFVPADSLSTKAVPYFKP